MAKTVTLHTLTCKRCGHAWTPRKRIVYQCPSCKTARWNVPKQVGRLMREIVQRSAAR